MRPCKSAPPISPFGATKTLSAETEVSDVTPIAWLALAATVLCSGGGNVIANWSHQFSGRWHLFVLALACGLQALGLVFYTVAITRIPLSIAYSILIGSTMVLVTLVSAIWFKERMSTRHLLGLAMIIVGMVMIKTGDTSRDMSALVPDASATLIDGGSR